MAIIDPTSPLQRTYGQLERISRKMGLAVSIIGILVLVGWVTDIAFLKRITTQTVAMNPVTALAFMAAGIALFLQHQDFTDRYQIQKRWLIYFVIGIGGLKLISLLLPFSIPFDQILFQKDLWETRLGLNNSIAPNTAITFVLIGISLLLINYETAGGRWPFQYFAIVANLFSLVSLYGYVYELSALYTVTSFLPMAIHTALAFFLLSLGILFARPHTGAMSILIGESSGQIIFMRVLALVLPLLFGWFRLYGEQAGYFNKELGTAFFAVLTYSMAMYLLGRRSYLQHQLRQTRKIAMDIIKENERRLQAILDHSGTNISLKTAEGNYSLVNKQFEKVFGVTAAEIIGKTDYDLFPEDLAGELNQFDKEILDSGEPKTFEEKYPQQDGIHTYLTVKFPLLDQAQEIYALGAVSTDISKRKHLEDELRKSHQRLFGILDNLGEGVIVSDSEGNLIIFNRRAEEILGTGAASASWKEWRQKFEFIKPDGETPFQLPDMPLNRALNGDPSDNVEMLVRNDKLPLGRWLAVTGRAVHNEVEEVIAGVIVFRDITLRKQLERLFSENEKRLKVILASIGEGIVIVNHDDSLLLKNEKAEEILGDGPNKLPPEKWPSTFGIFTTEGHLFPGEDFPLVLGLKGQEVSNVEVLVKNDHFPEGKNVFLSARPITGTNGEITGAILDLKDITQQRKLEDYLKEMEDQFRKFLINHQPNF